MVGELRRLRYRTQVGVKVPRNKKDPAEAGPHDRRRSRDAVPVAVRAAGTITGVVAIAAGRRAGYSPCAEAEARTDSTQAPAIAATEMPTAEMASAEAARLGHGGHRRETGRQRQRGRAGEERLPPGRRSFMVCSCSLGVEMGTAHRHARRYDNKRLSTNFLRENRTIWLWLEDVSVSDAGQAGQRPVVRAKGDIVVGLGQLRRLASDRVADDSEALLGAYDEAIEAARLASQRP